MWSLEKFAISSLIRLAKLYSSRWLMTTFTALHFRDDLDLENTPQTQLYLSRLSAASLTTTRFSALVWNCRFSTLATQCAGNVEQEPRSHTYQLKQLWDIWLSAPFEFWFESSLSWPVLWSTRSPHWCYRPRLDIITHTRINQIRYDQLLCEISHVQIEKYQHSILTTAHFSVQK